MSKKEEGKSMSTAPYDQAWMQQNHTKKIIIFDESVERMVAADGTPPNSSIDKLNLLCH